jgi:tetratricopeptide (TPR) repeat protein
VLSAEELHRRGVAAMNAGRLALASRYMERALDRAKDPSLRARIEASLAYVATDKSDLTSALSQCQRALDFPDLPPYVRGVLLAQRAVILRRSGRASSSLQSFAEAIDELRDAPAELAKAYINRGTVHLDRGEPDLAARDFAEAASQCALAGEHELRAMADHNLGYALFRSGDLVGAIRAMEKAQRVLGPTSAVNRAVGEQDLAEVQLAAGLVREGTFRLQGAVRDYGSRRLRQRQGEAELTLASSLQSYDPPAARRSARSAGRRFRRLGAEEWRARAEAEVLTAETGLGGTSRRLIEEADRLSAVLDEQGLRWPAAKTRLLAARVAVRRGSHDEANRRLSGVRLAGSPLDVRLLAADVRAELAAAQGRRAGAFRHLRGGLADLHAWQSSFGSLDLQTNVAGHGVRLGTRGLALAVASRQPATLFEWSERARMLASRVQPVRAPQSAEIVEGLAELRDSVPPAREAELRARIRELAWRHDGSREVMDPVSLQELQAALDPETALVAYVVAASQVVALVVTGSGAAWHDLGPRGALDELLGGLLPDLDMAASDLPDPIGPVVRGSLVGRLERLAALLVEPLAGGLGDHGVVLTPSGVLAGVPWPLLPGLLGRPVTVAQSATSWLARRSTPLRTASAGFVAGPRVARAEDEVTASAKEWPSAAALTGSAATAAAVSALAASVDVLHVAAHGQHSAENPLFSGLQLADGLWFGYDIDQLSAVPDVVLLSACEVGRSTVRWGEELIGMATAWLHAGARCVIASPAAVADEAAYDALVAVHHGLAHGLAPAQALAAAVPAPTADRPPVPLVCFG